MRMLELNQYVKIKGGHFEEAAETGDWKEKFLATEGT